MKINWFKIKTNVIISYLYNLIESGTPDEYTGFLIYLKQGSWCKDCNNSCEFCLCNFCTNCNLDYCLCNLKFKTKDRNYWNEKDILILLNEVKKFIKFNLSKNNINLVRKKIIGENMTDNRKLWLKSIGLE